jgi:hypothetical protein
MGVALVKKDDGGDDPRGDLRRAIVARAAAHAKAGQQQEVIHRARNMVTVAEAKVTVAGEALEAARSEHAETLAEAAQTGTAPKGNTELRTARQALADAEDQASAAKAALDHLEADGDDLKAANPELENSVLVAVSQVIAPIAEQILAQIQRAQLELQIAKLVFLALTDGEESGAPAFRSDIQKLNAKDKRMAPLQELRNTFFNLDSRTTGQERAKEAAAAWRKWRESLRRDPDAEAPELPAPFRVGG